MRWLYKLEYKMGRHYIRNLMMFISIAMAAVYVLDLSLTMNLSYWLSFNTALIYEGQVWRILTFLIVPPGGGAQSPFLLLITLYVYYAMGNLLENMWGGFRLNVYYLLGIIGAIAAGFLNGFIFGPLMGFANNSALNSTLMLAVACSMPDTTFRLFFILPIKAKWIAIAYFALMLPDVINAFTVDVTYGVAFLVTTAFSLVNFFIFFGPTLFRSFKDWMRIRKNRRNWQNRNR